MANDERWYGWGGLPPPWPSLRAGDALIISAFRGFFLRSACVSTTKPNLKYPEFCPNSIALLLTSTQRTMAPAKKQRQAQKQQEQQISQALAQTAPKSSHRSFEDDDDEVVALDDDSVQQTQLSVVDQNGSADSEDDADDAPIEVVSNKISRKQAAEQASKVKAQEKE